ncbi:MAG: diguanylate cyclase [Candidatus Baltobacteraceae bacterium]
MNAGRKAVYGVIRFGALFATALLFAFNARTIAAILAGHWAECIVLLGFFCLLLALGVPFIAFPQFGHRDSTDGQITLDLPVFALTFAIFGWTITALLSFLAYTIAIATGRQYKFRERILIAATRVPFWAIAGAAAAALHVPLQHEGAAGFAWFVGFNTAWAFAFIVLWFDPLTAIRTGRPVYKLWSMHVRDLTLWAIVAAQMLWAYVSTVVYLHAGPAFGVATFLPVGLLAVALRALHHERLAAHRMALARDAVWNLLQARDPAAQINSILASVHGDAPLETLQIYARLRTEDRPSPLASVGPWPGEERMPLVRRALLELHAHNKDCVTVRDDEGAVTAYGVRAGRLLGSLVVHRPHGAPARVPPRRYAGVAEELAPLLRDVRSVVAAHDAASIDSLTGLLNRASIMRILRDHIANVGPGGGCAVLLLDIDNFKSVNDRLGHLAGDQCLRVVAETLARNVRPADRAGRIGGEEFLVVMPLSSAPAALSAGERLRRAVEASGAQYADGSPVTASIGVAAASVADSMESVLERADRALYQAKNMGRNRVIEIAG